MIITCRHCKKKETIPVTIEQYTNWKNGTIIQKAMPNLTASQREMLISRTCVDCWEKLFAEGSDQINET